MKIFAALLYIVCSVIAISTNNPSLAAAAGGVSTFALFWDA